MNSPLTPRPASTLILLRDGLEGLEVLLMQRTLQASFLAGAYVFPGGAVDPGDLHADFAAHAAAAPAMEERHRSRMESDDLQNRVAAIRECFEEAGLLMACDEQGEMLALHHSAAAETFATLRKRMVAGELGLRELCRAHNLRLAVERLTLFSHWITPLGAPRRFDTRFFIAIAPPAQTPSHDDRETIAHRWLRPEAALEQHRSGEINIVFATARTLEALAEFTDADAAIRHACALHSITPLMPRAATGSNGHHMLVPQDHAYAEVAIIDPAGTGKASSEIIPGRVIRLGPSVRRITAPNRGYMTGPGTNTYLLGAGDEIAIIDPGPDNDDHIEAVLANAGGRIRWILATHTHPDHSPAAWRLKEKTGAQLLGMPPPAVPGQDQSFRPDRILQDGERLNLAGFMVRVLHTPGHASNHLCYLLEGEGMLFTGDHVMQGSTVVINPPDGDMREYLHSLRALHSQDITCFAPGHGFLMDQPHARIDRLLAHRLARENSVLNALLSAGSASVEELVPMVYADLPIQRHPVAARSLLAHLMKLEAEQRVSHQNESWTLGNS